MSITLTDDTPTASTYKVISNNNAEIICRDSASSLDEPRTFRESHTASKDPNGSDRHFAQCVRVDDDADGVPQTGTVHVVLVTPREGVSNADMKLEWEKLKNHIDDNWSDFSNGFKPEG